MRRCPCIATIHSVRSPQHHAQIDKAVAPRAFQVLLHRFQRRSFHLLKTAQAIRPVAPVRLGQVQCHVDQVDAAFPRERPSQRRQRIGGKAHGHVHLDGLSLVVDDLRRHAVEDAPRDIVEAVPRDGGQEGEEFLAAPAHDHVRFAQHVVQGFGDRRQHQVARCVAVTVVDVLEMVDIEQEQCPHDIAAAGRLRLARMAAHEFLEVAAVVQGRQRVARALALEFLVLHLQLHVRVAHLAVQQADDDGRHGQHQRQQPPYALLQAAVVDFRAFQLIFAAEQLDLALLLFRFIFFL